jgi:hypothetical protein
MSDSTSKPGMTGFSGGVSKLRLVHRQVLDADAMVMIAATGIYLVGSSQTVAAARNLASLGKSRKAVVVPTPPVEVPLTTNVTRIKVHIGCRSLPLV